MPIKTYLLIFLFELGFGIKFNIVGEISISELFLLVYTPFIISRIRWSKAKELKTISITYFLLLSVQILSEIFVSNGLSSSLKGLAITVVSYFHFIFLFYNLTKDKRLILVLILSQIAMRILFGTSFEEQSAEDILAGKAAVYLKYYIAPLSILIFLAVSILYNNRNLPIIFSFLCAFFILLGARSSGGMALFAGMVACLINYKKLIPSKITLFLMSVVLLLVGYGFYFYYVNQVLSGNITSGNSWQLLACKNPYNPLELLMIGRRETWVGWQAFMDRFWFGHGAWAYDTTGHYQRLMYALTDNLSALTKDRISYHFLVPSHSVIVGSGMMNGVFAFLLVIYIIFFFLKKGLLVLGTCDRKYLLVLAYYEYNLLWNGWLSPQSHFRSTIPIAFAIILSIYLISKNNKIVQNKRYE